MKKLVILTVAMFTMVALNSVTSALWRSGKTVAVPQMVSRSVPTPVAAKKVPETYQVSGRIGVEIK